MGDGVRQAVVICPGCLDSHYSRNGMVGGRQRYRCRECGRQFTGGRIDEVLEARVTERLREVAVMLVNMGVPVAKVTLATDVSKSWLYQRGSIAAGRQDVGEAGE